MNCVVSLTKEERDKLGMAIEAAAMELCRAARSDVAGADYYRNAVTMLDDSKMVLYPDSALTREGERG